MKKKISKPTRRVNNSRDAVNDALDAAKKILLLRSDRQLAMLLDLEKQNVAAWRSRGELPASRAVQIEYFTQGKIKWEELCPKLLSDTASLSKGQ
jgi:DNA-binding transcriptional regulator YdaS (Cro superfamily)